MYRQDWQSTVGGSSAPTECCPAEIREVRQNYRSQDLTDWTDWSLSWICCVSSVCGDRWVIPATWSRRKLKGEQMNWNKIIAFCFLAFQCCYFETIIACFFIREITSNSPVAFLVRAGCYQGNIKALLKKEMMKTAGGWLVSPTQTILHAFTLQIFRIVSLTWGDCLLQIVLLMSEWVSVCVCVFVCVCTHVRVCVCVCERERESRVRHEERFTWFCLLSLSA